MLLLMRLIASGRCFCCLCLFALSFSLSLSSLCSHSMSSSLAKAERYSLFLEDVQPMWAEAKPHSLHTPINHGRP